MFCFGLVSLPVGMREHELWHPQQLQGIWFQALPQLVDNRQFHQEPQSLRAQQIKHDSLQDLTCFCKYLICSICRNISFLNASIRMAISSDYAASICSIEVWRDSSMHSASFARSSAESERACSSIWWRDDDMKLRSEAFKAILLQLSLGECR